MRGVVDIGVEFGVGDVAGETQHGGVGCYVGCVCAEEVEGGERGGGFVAAA